MWAWLSFSRRKGWSKQKTKKSDLKNILQKFGKKSSLRITFMVVTATVCLFFFFFCGVLTGFSWDFPSLWVARDLVTTYHDSTACAHVPWTCETDAYRFSPSSIFRSCCKSLIDTKYSAHSCACWASVEFQISADVPWRARLSLWACRQASFS